MRKLLLPLCFLAFVHYELPAQLRIAMVGGAHTASVNETNSLPDLDNLESKYSSRTGVHFGFMADLQLGPVSNLYFQPGVVLVNKGRKFSNTYDTSVFEYSSIDAAQYVNYIEVPLNLVYKFPIGQKVKFFIGGGPSVSFLYNGKEKTETFYKNGDFVTVENTDLPVGNGPGKYKTLDLGANGTAGLEFGKIFIAANFSRSITNFYEASYESSFRHQVIGGTLGIFLGRPVELDPNTKDKDMDGIADAKDECPDVAGNVITNGCPDIDADGIADYLDKCPQQKGLVKYNGCPAPDTDGDGVNDDEDKCKDIAGLKSYNGCPVPDTDKDGINDEDDKCKNEPGLGRYNGCPIPDKDGDGINDEEDKCPGTPGSKANGGCAEIRKEIIEKVAYAAKRIQFTFAKAELLPESMKVLDEVAGILLKNPELKLEIEGHTSSEGSYNANMKLSNERAEAVRDYIAGKGIDISRLSAKGYGPDRPLNQGNTPEEKAINRRVEMKLSNN